MRLALSQQMRQQQVAPTTAAQQAAGDQHLHDAPVVVTTLSVLFSALSVCFLASLMQQVSEQHPPTAAAA